MSDYRAAWVPETKAMDWDEATELAVEWVEQECAEMGASGVLVTNALSSGDVPALRRFASRHVHTSPQANRSRVGRGIGPVLAYVPDLKALTFAADLARGASLCVVEGVGTPMSGWARAAQAVNLLTGETEAVPDPALTEALNRLHFYGNNEWNRGFGQDQALHILSDLRAAGLLDQEAITGDMLARGHTNKGVQRLAQLIEKVAQRR